MADPKPPPVYDGYLSTGEIRRVAKDDAEAIKFGEAIIRACLHGTPADLTQVNWVGALLQGDPTGIRKRVLFPASGAVQKLWRSREGKTFPVTAV